MSKSLYLINPVINPASVGPSYFGATVFEQRGSGSDRKPDSRLRLSLMHA